LWEGAGYIGFLAIFDHRKLLEQLLVLPSLVFLKSYLSAFDMASSVPPMPNDVYVSVPAPFQISMVEQ
jgi:hypothetical protein